MTEEKIKDLLRRADQAAAGPSVPVGLAAGVRRRARRRHVAALAAPVAAAAIILIGLGIWAVTGKSSDREQAVEKQTIAGQIGGQAELAGVKDEVALLKLQADATMRLISEVLESDRRQRRLAELEAQLAGIPDPIKEIEKQVDKAAFIIVYQADRMYRELNLKDSAVESYRQAIRLFPKTQWAKVARQRLSEIQDKQFNEGDLLWKPAKLHPSC